MAKTTNEARIQSLEQGQAALAGKLDEAIGGINKLADVVTQIASRDAQHVPVAPKKYHEAAEQFLGGPGAAEFKEVDGEQLLESTTIADVNSPRAKEKLTYEAFMRETLCVQIAEVHNTDEAQIFDIAVNGETWTFKRGQMRDGVPRYIVEGLARARPIGYTAQEYRDEQNLTQIRYNPHKGVRYPFSLVNATSRDQAWLNHVLAQP